MIKLFQVYPHKSCTIQVQSINPSDIASVSSETIQGNLCTRVIMQSGEITFCDTRSPEEFLLAINEFSKSSDCMSHPIRKTNLGELLEEILVSEVDEPNADYVDVTDWYAVSNSEGNIAYFGNEKHAFAFRLFLINSILNT